MEGEEELKVGDLVMEVAVKVTVPGTAMIVGSRAAISHADAARTALRKAAGLLREATDAAEKVAAGMLALVPPGAAPLPEDAVEAAAKLVSCAFLASAPLPEAVDAAADLVCIASSGLLQEAQGALGRLAVVRAQTGDLSASCARHLGLQPGDARWWRWRRSHVDAMSQAKMAEAMLSAAADGRHGAKWVIRLCLVGQSSPGRAKRVGVADAEEILRYAIGEVDQALGRMRGAVALQEQVLRDAPGPEGAAGSSNPG